MPVRNRRKCHVIASGALSWQRTSGRRRGSGVWEAKKVERKETASTLLFEPVFDGDATCFVGISACGSVLSEGKRGRKVLVTGGTRMCARCGAGRLAWGCVGGLTW